MQILFSKRLKRSFATAAICFSVSMGIAFPRTTYALSQDSRTMVRAGTYGALAGTAVGLAVLPLTGSARGVFIGTSIGLYLGLIMGVYHISHRDDPQNPLRERLGSERDPGLWPESPTRIEQPKLVEISYPLLTF